MAVQDRKVGGFPHWPYASITACERSAYHSVSLLIGAFSEDIPYAQVQGETVKEWPEKDCHAHGASAIVVLKTNACAAERQWAFESFCRK
jgi:hypothetical protein